MMNLNPNERFKKLVEKVSQSWDKYLETVKAIGGNVDIINSCSDENVLKAFKEWQVAVVDQQSFIAEITKDRRV
ncbi:hypothetical protein [Chitinophaga sp.]|uniref:hypothetical protein n=1 Tax=Chitinophaga sp. TaxID=1869181 RepID=UPI0031D3AC64